MENKKSFIAYCDWKETFEALPDDKAGQLIKHIFSYVADEDPETDDVLINAVFANIKNTLKRDLQKWEKQHQQRIDAGKRSAELRKQASTTVKRPLNDNKQSSTVSVSDNVSVTVNDTDSVIKKKTVNIPFEEFWNFYDKKVGDKTKIKKKWEKLKDSDRIEIINYIPKYKLSEPNKKFRKNPDTFFNNKSWNDEIISSNLNQKPNGQQTDNNFLDSIINAD